MHDADLLIIGAGVAGCTAALEAADAGLSVTLVTNAKAPERGSNTSWAQGGIIYKGENDSAELLAQDIQKAGVNFCNAEAVKIVSEEGPALVEKILLERIHMQFDLNAAGELDLTEEGAHSRPRIIHVEDRTGDAIAKALGQAVEAHPNVQLLTDGTAVDLILKGYHTKNDLDVYATPECLGAYVLMPGGKEVAPVLARETILATGGVGQIFLHTTNPKRARGDGLAMAYRAGARVINMEYVQFHPTSFYHQLAPRFLLSESLRGEGAILLNSHFQPFMKNYDPLGDLAARDVVARAIHEEMLSDGSSNVYLDISHRNADWVRNRFPLIYNYLKKWDVDLTKEPVPVVPAAHYSCGGVASDAYARTSVNRLRVVGEVACTGLHGANRLASTSLLEGLVYGSRAGLHIARNLKDNSMPQQDTVRDWVLQYEEVDPALIAQDWMTIKQTMWNYVGLVRSGRRMERALRILRGLQFDVETFYRRAALTDQLIGLRNGAQAALALTHAALRNKTSRGGHYRVH
ncbi:MAG: L-aspartate oxidase [Sumerlaeia bacterium]